MSSDGERPAYLLRIEQRIREAGITERIVNMEGFGHANGLKNLRSGVKSPGIETFRRLAPILGVSPGWLAFGERGEGDPTAATIAPDQALRVAGEVAAGRWHEIDTGADAPAVDCLPIVPDPRWPAAAQYVMITRGSSLDRIAPDGSALACVDTRVIEHRPQDGEVVIVERRRYGGSMIERTGKRFRRLAADRFELWPDSHDPRWRDPIVVAPGEEEEGTEIEVIGLAGRIVQPVQIDMPWMRN